MTAVDADIAPNRIAFGIAVAVTAVAAAAVVLRWRIGGGVEAVATMLTSAKIGYWIEPATAVAATLIAAGTTICVRTRSALAVAVTAVAAVAAAGRIRPALAVAVTAVAAVMVSGAAAPVAAVAARGLAQRGEKPSIYTLY